MMTLTLPDGRRLFKNQRDLADELVRDPNSGLSSDAGTMQGRLSAVFGGDSLSDELRAAILRATIRRLQAVDLPAKMRHELKARVESGLTGFRQSIKRAGKWGQLKVELTDHVWFFQSERSGLELVSQFIADTLAGFQFRTEGSFTIVTASIPDGVQAWQELGKALRESAKDLVVGEFLATTTAVRVIAESFSHPTSVVVINPKHLTPDVRVFADEGVVQISRYAALWATACRRVDATPDFQPSFNAWLRPQPVEPGLKVEITFRDAKPWLSDFS